MSDIVARLRACHGIKSGDPECCCEEAADEIERLQSCLYAQESVPALYKEIERLKAENKQLQEDLNRCRAFYEAWEKAGRTLGIRK